MTETASEDLQRPWYRSWTKWSVIATVALALPSFFAGGAWAVNYFENRGIALASKQEADEILSTDHSDLQGVKMVTTQQTGIIESMSGNVQSLVESEKENRGDIKKILWYLIDARKSEGNAASRPSDEALARDP